MGAQVGFITAAGLQPFSWSNIFSMQINLTLDVVMVSAH